ncbi:MAG: hypothetical protein ACI9KE_001917, partial [Polyangiales bacterium]
MGGLSYVSVTDPKTTESSADSAESEADDLSGARLVVRPLTFDDIDVVIEIQRECFPDIPPWNPGNLRDHIATFPAGQIGIELDGVLVASSSSLIVEGKSFEEPHDFEAVVPGGFLTNHDDEGDVLYGVDIVVRPDARGMRFARRIYEARQNIIRELNLRQLVIAGRLPNYGQHADAMSAREYVGKVVRKDLSDPVLTAQLANGFVLRMVLDDYIPSDKESRGHAALMQWLNPAYVPPDVEPRPSKARVAAVQYQMRRVESFEDFSKQAEFFIDTASDYRCDFVLFPELLTNQLLGLLPPDRPGAVARALDT